MFLPCFEAENVLLMSLNLRGIVLRDDDNSKLKEIQRQPSSGFVSPDDFEMF